MTGVLVVTVPGAVQKGVVVVVLLVLWDVLPLVLRVVLPPVVRDVLTLVVALPADATDAGVTVSVVAVQGEQAGAPVEQEIGKSVLVSVTMGVTGAAVAGKIATEVLSVPADTTV